MKVQYLLFLVFLAWTNHSCIKEVEPQYGFNMGYYATSATALADRYNVARLEVRENKLILDMTCATLVVDTLPRVSTQNTFVVEGTYNERLPKNSTTYYNVTVKTTVKGKFKNNGTLVISFDERGTFSANSFELYHGRYINVINCDDIRW